MTLDSNTCLLERALCHPSYANENGCNDYQRLEFIGDAVLQLITTEWLMEMYPDATEGQLTSARKALVNNETLAESARMAGLDQKLKVGKGAENDGIRSSTNVLADCFEAYIGAIFQTNGYNSAMMFVSAFLNEDKIKSYRDYKSELQNVLQARKLQHKYILCGEPGIGNLFEVEIVTSKGESLCKGTGKSLKAAQQNAAAKALGRFA